MTDIGQFPHCDQRVLHAPGECEYCDQRPDWQALREAWGIAFTGHIPKAYLPKCDEPFTYEAGGEIQRCKRARGHPGRPVDGFHYLGGHSAAPEQERMPCPADFARPPGSDADHRRWGGNVPPGRRGQPGEPEETFASRVLYGEP
jgi:hypothetical protein